MTVIGLTIDLSWIYDLACIFLYSVVTETVSSPIVEWVSAKNCSSSIHL